MTNSFLFSVKKGPKTLLDFLTLWVLCSVWPGAIPAFLVMIESHRFPLSIFLSIFIGLISAIYIWKFNTTEIVSKIISE